MSLKRTLLRRQLRAAGWRGTKASDASSTQRNLEAAQEVAIVRRLLSARRRP